MNIHNQVSRMANRLEQQKDPLKLAIMRKKLRELTIEFESKAKRAQ